MQPHQNDFKLPITPMPPPSGEGGDGSGDHHFASTQPNLEHDGSVTPKFAIRTGSEGVIILSRPAQQSGEAQNIPKATRGEKVGLRTLVNEDSIPGNTLPAVGCCCCNSSLGLLGKKLIDLIEHAGDGPSAGYNHPPLSPSRTDTFLGLIAKKFFDLIEHAEDGTLCLTEAANKLKLGKTYICDVANILEGAGLLEKTHNNPISWKYVNFSTPEEFNLQEEIATLNLEEHNLDGRIREMQEKLKVLNEDENSKMWNFVTKEDLKSLPCIQNKMLFVVKAPHGTTVETPDSDEAGAYPQRRHGLTFRSTSGDIDVYLISKHEEILQINKGQEASLFPEPPAADVRGNEEISAQRTVAPDYTFDDDSWLWSDMDASITDTRTEPEIDWDSFHAWVDANQNAFAPVPLNDARENVINPSKEAQSICSNTSTSQDTSTVTNTSMPVFTMGADYWLSSNNEASISDMWTEYEVGLNSLLSLDEALADKKPSEDDPMGG